MIAGLSGSLLSHDALGGPGTAALDAAVDAAGCAAARRQLQAWHRHTFTQMGPACGVRAVYDRLADPLMSMLGFTVTVAGASSGDIIRALLFVNESPAAVLLVTAWGRDPGTAWRDGVRYGIGAGVRWCICVTGPVLRILDARRTYSRRFAEFDLQRVLEDDTAFAMFWRLLRAQSFDRPLPVLDLAVQISESYRAEVRASLQSGVHDALGHLLQAFGAAHHRRRRVVPAAAVFDESLIVIYRILFLLFAEARGLVPKWHPIYRDGYTVELLREQAASASTAAGLWESLQAIARLAHRGCNAGTLRVPPFNGRLFSPAEAPLAESVSLDDGAVKQALIALTTRATRTGPQRIAYADLGVEQLGGVYERILDYDPLQAASGGAITLVPAERRRATGSFYTPRSLTEYLVRRTLAPLVRGASSDGILSLRVLDPAMGSGAFLVAACRYLALAYESALLAQGVVSSSDITDRERAAFRRAVAQRCLFGVDINPMAVQLGRLSLWLATLAGDRPLTFLDHHLRTGNSLAGASLEDIARPPVPQRAPRRGLPLFESAAADAALGLTAGSRMEIAHDAGDTLEQVRRKERTLSSLNGNDAPLARWKAVADLWCAQWFDDGPRAGAAFGALVDELLARGSVLPSHVSAPLLDRARGVAARERFFHWELEFPEVFYDRSGQPLAAPGFDAILGNPPWEMLRADRGDEAARRRAGKASAWLTTFTRRAGVYSLQGDGHANLYQLFVERVLSLVRRGGRIGLVVPAGFATDHGCAALRRHTFGHTGIDTFVSVENREGLFPIHRGLKFILLCATAGSTTAALPCRSGLRSPQALDELPDTGPDPGAVHVPRGLLEKMSGDQLAVPELRTPRDLEIASRIAFSIPRLSDPEGWHVTFGRELNATDDRAHFAEARGGRRGYYPIVEGKQIQPFVVDTAAAKFHIRADVAATLLRPARTYNRPRLAYRDVASSSNRLTLIAAIIPARVVTTHTLFCLKSNLDIEAQQFLCGVFNSYVANYLVRLRVGTHVTVSIIETLPVPRPRREARLFTDIALLAERLAFSRLDEEAAAALQARVARLYGLTAGDFAHVLDSFPLIPAAERAAAWDLFRRDAI